MDLCHACYHVKIDYIINHKNYTHIGDKETKNLLTNIILFLPIMWCSMLWGPLTQQNPINKVRNTQWAQPAGA